jgi:outer membrane protein OmpA-like peptidoglycan-associated protein
MKNHSNNSNKKIVTLLVASCLIGGVAEARRLLPELPSVEVRLEALRILQHSMQDNMRPAEMLDNKVVAKSSIPFMPANNYTPPVVIAPVAPVVAPVAPIIKEEIAKPAANKAIKAKTELVKIEPKLPEKKATKPKIEPVTPVVPMVELPKIEPEKVEPEKVEPKEPILPKVPPVDIIKENPAKTVENVSEEVSLEELLKYPEPKEIEKTQESEHLEKLPAPELPLLEPDFEDMAKINDKPNVKLPEPTPSEPDKQPDQLNEKMEDKLAEIEKQTIEAPADLPLAELPKDEIVKDEIAGDDLPVELDDIKELNEPAIIEGEMVDSPLIEPKNIKPKDTADLAAEEKLPELEKIEPIQKVQQVELPQEIIEEADVKEPAIQSPPSKPQEKSGLFPNLSSGFASFLGGEPKTPAAPPVQPEVKSETKIEQKSTDELPNLPQFNNAKPPVDEPLPELNFDKEDEIASHQTQELPALPEFGNDRQIKIDNTPLPTLPFGENKSIENKSSENQAAKIMGENSPTKPVAAEEKAVKSDSALSIVFSQSETEVPLAAQKQLILLAKQLSSDATSNIQIVAYASGSEDQASVARRVSLARALAVRAFLIDLGIDNTRISPKAMGNKIPSGSPERADIIIIK